MAKKPPYGINSEENESSEENKNTQVDPKSTEEKEDKGSE